ncbi:putative Zn-dependent peptidase [Salegentibacter sp. 24]|uniref:M16 family metallopeptidase n=1 Tax=Salegentibacter sp. 24 TaxID=2183986 RepID=UPI001061AA70|nr:insulinase family protein [Salegentibacter sp. 24]TDN87075.1 putative Zn-dependent peptidase [Salegentibacter sp. 24]
MNSLKTLVVWSLIFLWILPVLAQTSSHNSEDSLTLDKSIRTGVLDNGLTYFIKPLQNSNQQITMNFLVKVGSQDEQQHELNFAHHIEHLSFRPSDNFPDGLKNNSKILSQFGMKMYDIYGRTGAGVTRYFYNVPYENEKAINTGLLWFKDIASGLDLNKKSIDRERGVLLQEYRGGVASRAQTTAYNDVHSTLFSVVNSKKSFSSHNRNFPHQDLQKFYNKWYQPQRMAVIIAGNIENTEQLEENIKSIFQELKSSENKVEPKGKEQSNPKREKNFTSVVRNSNGNSAYEFKAVNMYFFYKHKVDKKKDEGLGRLQRQIQGEIVTDILKTRFSESSKIDDRTTIYSSYTPVWNIPRDMLTITINTELQYEKVALENTLYILRQFVEYGITEEEFKNAKDNILETLESYDTSKNRYWVNEIEDYFVNGQALPTNKKEIITNWLSKLSKEEINRLIKEIIKPSPDKMGLIFPEDSESPLISKEKTQEIIKKKAMKKVLPYKPKSEIKRLLSQNQMDSLPIGKKLNAKPGKLDTEIYSLKNGSKLILKPMKSTNSNALTIRGFSPFGASYFPKEEYNSTMFATSIIRSSGVGSYEKKDLKKFYENTQSIKLGFNPYIFSNESGFESEVSIKELDKFLQLLYLYFTKPRKDQAAFENWKKGYLQDARYIINPSKDLIDALKKVTRDSTRLPIASDLVKASQRVNLNVAHRNYQELFGNIGNFTFIVTGDFDSDAVLTAFQKYVGNIPSNSRTICTDKNKAIEIPDGPKYYELSASDLYETENSFYGIRFVHNPPDKKVWQEELKIRVLGQMLNSLIYDLRDKEELSLYTISAGAYFDRRTQRFEVQFRFSCLPEQLPIIREKTNKIIENLKEADISEKVFENQKNRIRSIYTPQALNQPSYIARKLYRYYRFEEPPIASSAIENYLKDLTFKEIIQTAKTYLKPEYMHEVKME